MWGILSDSKFLEYIGINKAGKNPEIMKTLKDDLRTKKMQKKETFKTIFGDRFKTSWKGAFKADNWDPFKASLRHLPQKLKTN